MSRAPFALLFTSLVALAIACGGSTSSGGAEPGDGGTDGSSPLDAASDASDAGTDLYPEGATKVVVTQKGGFGIAPPDGSVCSVADTTYTLDLSSRELSWKVCEYGDGGPFAYRTGQTTISAADFAAVSTALHGLRRTTKPQCGADKPSEEIVFTTPSGEVTYYDDFYFCDPKDTKPYVSGIDEVLGELAKLAK